MHRKCSVTYGPQAALQRCTRSAMYPTVCSIEMVLNMGRGGLTQHGIFLRIKKPAAGDND